MAGARSRCRSPRSRSFACFACAGSGRERRPGTDRARSDGPRAVTGSQQNDETAGCVGWVLVAFVIALVVAALISVAALVDPFAWMPPVGEIWAECDDDFGTERDECALANRFPGFWWHAIANLAYAAAALVLSVAFASTVVQLREKRVARFSSFAAAAEHRSAVQLAVGLGVALAAVSLLPIAVAVA